MKPTARHNPRRLIATAAILLGLLASVSYGNAWAGTSGTTVAAPGGGPGPKPTLPPPTMAPEARATPPNTGGIGARHVITCSLNVRTQQILGTPEAWSQFSCSGNPDIKTVSAYLWWWDGSRWVMRAQWATSDWNAFAAGCVSGWHYYVATGTAEAFHGNWYTWNGEGELVSHYCP